MGKLQALATGTTEGHVNLAGKFTTDKVEHGYLLHYERYLPKTVNRFMEMGVWKGEGLRLFREYYDGIGEFHAMDYFGSTDIEMMEAQLKSEGFITHKGSDDDVHFLRTIKQQFDVICEDASHHSDSQIICFKQMFLNNIISGGLYVAEDLHCCKEQYWWRSVKSYNDTLLAAFKRVIAGGDFTSQYFSLEDNKQLKKLIAEIHLEDDKICFIKRK